MSRFIVSLIALLGLTAFAPAPFPKAERRGGEPRLDLNAIQGTWTAVSIDEMQSNGKLNRIGWGVRRIYVIKDRWGFDTTQGFYLTLNTASKPPTIDFRDGPGGTGATGISGVLRLQGDTLQMLYVFSQPDTRPTNFDKMRTGDRLMTLKRESR